MAHGRGLVNGGDEQAPHRCGHHHPGGKAGEGALDHVAERAAHEKYASRPQRCAQKRDQKPEKSCIFLGNICHSFHWNGIVTQVPCKCNGKMGCTPYSCRLNEKIANSLLTDNSKFAIIKSEKELFAIEPLR